MAIPKFVTAEKAISQIKDNEQCRVCWLYGCRTP